MNTVRTLLLACLALSALPASATDEVIVYSARTEELIKPLFDAYTGKTGVEIRYITDKEGPLLARLQAEGENTPADMLITVDAGNLWQAAKRGVLAPYASGTGLTGLRMVQGFQLHDGRLVIGAIHMTTPCITKTRSSLSVDLIHLCNPCNLRITGFFLNPVNPVY